MKVAKFIFKCILVLIPVIAVILYTAFCPFGYMDSEYPSWKYSKDIPAAADVVILGDSRAMSDLIPDSFTPSTANLAIGGATPIEMYYTLENYINKYGVPKNVVIMFAPFHYTIIDNFWNRTAYFNYLSIPQTNELFAYAASSHSETLIKSGYTNDLISYRVRFPDKYLPALINSKLIGRYQENLESFNNISDNLGHGLFGTENGSSDLNYETTYDRMHTTGDAVLLDVYFEKLLSLCEINNINTYLSIPPMNRASYEQLKPSYVEDLTDYLNDMSKKHPDINIDSSIPMYENSLFGDSSHLNASGAEIFTNDYNSSHMFK